MTKKIVYQLEFAQIQFLAHFATAAASKKASNNAAGNGTSNHQKVEKGPSPRKLVRGQDVWLGKGEEQTRQILKCMWCGQSFRSLADLTTHMSETKHYTKVIPQVRATHRGSLPSLDYVGEKSILHTQGKCLHDKILNFRSNYQHGEHNNNNSSNNNHSNHEDPIHHLIVLHLHHYQIKILR